MSATPLSDIQSVIERSIFETIRLELVDKGYLPDITTFTSKEAYEAAVKAIQESKGFAIEIFNEGSNYAKDTKKVPRIVINSGSFLPGALGGDPQRYFENAGTSYIAKVTPAQTVDFFLDIHLVSETVAQERILNGILALSVPRRGYTPWYNDSNKTFFTRYLDYYDADNTSGGFIEKVFSYEIPDCWDSNDREFAANIAKIVEITLHPNIQKYEDGSWGSNSTPIVVT